jgi:RNA polymerase sigma-70 factor (ECF subfamily)
MTDPGETDEALMRRYARGEASAFEELYRRHELRLWRYLLRNVRHRAIAEELSQETWFAVAREAPRYVPSARFTTWLFTIAHHRMIDAFRSRRPQVSLEALGPEAEVLMAPLSGAGGGDPLGEALRRDQAAALLAAIGELPAEQREALVLQLEGELSVEEIAAITQSSFETTKSRLRYARDRLRERLKEFA